MIENEKSLRDSIDETHKKVLNFSLGISEPVSKSGRQMNRDETMSTSREEFIRSRTSEVPLSVNQPVTSLMTVKTSGPSVEAMTAAKAAP